MFVIDVSKVSRYSGDFSFFFFVCFFFHGAFAVCAHKLCNLNEDFVFYLCVFCLCLQLAPIKLSRYSEDLLFYLYYTNGGDILQLAAAAEL